MHRLGSVVPALHSSSETWPKACGWVEVSQLGRPSALLPMGEALISCSPAAEEDTFYITKSSCLSKGIRGWNCSVQAVDF